MTAGAVVMKAFRCRMPNKASPSWVIPAAVRICGEGLRFVERATRSGPETANVRIAELAAQNWVSAVVSETDLCSAIDGRIRPPAANPAATSAPVAFSASRAVRVRPEGCAGLIMGAP